MKDNERLQAKLAKQAVIDALLKHDCCWNVGIHPDRVEFIINHLKSGEQESFTFEVNPNSVLQMDIFEWEMSMRVSVLQQQLEQRDKRIAEFLQERCDSLEKSNQVLRDAIEFKKKNRLMLSALEEISRIYSPACTDRCGCAGCIARKTIAQVKGGSTQ